ncbi:MAG: 30S ribosomal protein S21 [Acidobacteria bacterium]|nr:30S ribosomal protein S21 [Acidobacteriota bacterium]
MATVNVNQGESIESALRRFKRKVMTEEITKPRTTQDDRTREVADAANVGSFSFCVRENCGARADICFQVEW